MEAQRGRPRMNLSSVSLRLLVWQIVQVQHEISAAADGVQCEPRRELPDRGNRRLILLAPSIAFMLLVKRFLDTEMLAKIG